MILLIRERHATLYYLLMTLTYIVVPGKTEFEADKNTQMNIYVQVNKCSVISAH